MQTQPASFAFTLLLGFLAAVPYSGIDINLPALAATAATLDVSPSEVGLTMSAFMLSLAVAPLLYGPVSDRFGRKPVVAFGIALFVVASLACALARSLPALLICRFVQGIGAASTAMTFAIVRDLFGETTARTKIANVVVAINVVTVIAPTAGAALLTIGGWRLIYAIEAAIGALLLLAVMLGFAESAKIDPTSRLAPAAVIRSYVRVLTHPVSLAYILVGAAGGATVFAYVTPLEPVPPSLLEQGVSAVTAADTRWARRDIKSTSLLANILLKKLSADAGAFETILLENGELTEGSSTTVHVVKDGIIHIPPKDRHVLPGTTRDVVTELAARLGLHCESGRISEAKLRAADEIWLAFSTRGVLPVTTLDGAAVGGGKPGPQFQRMHAAFDGYTRELTGTPAL